MFQIQQNLSIFARNTRCIYVRHLIDLTRMQRAIAEYPLENSPLFKTKVLNWAQQFDTVVWLDSNSHEQKYAQYEAVLAIDTHRMLKSDYSNAFEKLKSFQNETSDYIFGYLGYDLKNDIEALQSQNNDQLRFPDLYFFQPKKLLFLSKDKVEFTYLSPYKESIETDYHAILNFNKEEQPATASNLNIKLRIHKEAYLQKVKTLLDHIHRGDLYEANFCQEFYSENSTIDPLEVYKKLNTISSPPFASFLKFEHNYVLSASPERYLKKLGDKVISQPIKGTARRATHKTEDQQLKENLENDPKEQAENIMIVDLVRNDLSRLSEKGSVVVEELCKVYSFAQVHQMISTVSAHVSEAIHPVDILKNTFPMGSMTGAPKVAAMEIIETLEETKRGLYSGAVGYISPNGDFDFNVVIRSILYNRLSKYVSFSVGSAITALANPEQELEECLLKAKAMREVLLCKK